MRGAFVGLGGWQKNSFIDYPGTVSTVLFFSGCNLRCPYCHNGRLACGETVDIVDPPAVRAFLEKRRGQIEGVVLSGGEPTIHESAADTAAAARALGYRVKLDTNGLLPDAIERIAPDYLALDLKTRPSFYRTLLRAPFDDVERRLTAALAQVRRMGERAEVRITAAPGLVDMAVVEELSELLEGVSNVYLQPMQQRYPLLDSSFNVATNLSGDMLEAMRVRVASRVGECRMRSGDESKPA
ncbi:MAG: anaerobic ribonucleoside-triphosphate reductase activating protein [Chitinivibrionales bacterium]|nr:anaerobic ribonucleoside-triphosphate reductase activating protein [Chitinivibrionales bacterium]